MVSVTTSLWFLKRLSREVSVVFSHGSVQGCLFVVLPIRVFTASFLESQ